MFSNPIGQMYKPDGEEKKKKRNKKSKKNLSPGISEDRNDSPNTSANSENPSVLNELVTGNPLLAIVSEINNAPTPVEAPVVETTPESESAPAEEPAVEQEVESAPVEESVETKYEELPVEESTMKTIIDSIHNYNTVPDNAWEEMLNDADETEAAWESEVAASPQAVDSVWEEMITNNEPAPASAPVTLELISEAPAAVESAWEDMFTAPGTEEAESKAEAQAEQVSAAEPAAEESQVDEQKERICNQFNISEISYQLVKDFFNEQQDADLLKNDLLRYLLKQSAENRAELEQVTDDDINRALNAIDSNHDDKINFDEFVQLLSLFYSSKNNLQERITGILNNLSSSHEKGGVLRGHEASSFSQFLDLFFGRLGETEIESNASEKSNFLSKLVKKILRRNKKSDDDNETHEDIDYATYSTEAAKDLQDRCFVKFKSD